MQIIHVAATPFGRDGLFGGGERYPLELARTLAADVDCELLTVRTVRSSGEYGRHAGAGPACGGPPAPGASGPSGRAGAACRAAPSRRRARPPPAQQANTDRALRVSSTTTSVGPDGADASGARWAGVGTPLTTGLPAPRPPPLVRVAGASPGEYGGLNRALVLSCGGVVRRWQCTSKAIGQPGVTL